MPLIHCVQNLLLQIFEGLLQCVIGHIFCRYHFLVNQHRQIVDVIHDLVIALLVLLEIYESVVDEGLRLRQRIKDVEVAGLESILIVIVVMRTDASRT